MNNVLDAFSTRAAALFETLPTRDAKPSFQLQVASREDLNIRRGGSTEDVVVTEPGPSPMTWSEVVDGSKNVEFDEEERLCEISVEARKAFEAEADYDEFDEVATGSIQFGYEEREKKELNREIVDADADAPRNRHRASQERVPRYLKYPQNYTCYTLDTPVYVGRGDEDGLPHVEEKDCERHLPQEAEMCDVHQNGEKDDGTDNGRIAFRCQKRRNDVQMKTSSSSSPSTHSVATEALRSFGESEAGEVEGAESAEEKRTGILKLKRSHRKYRTQPLP